MLQWWFWYGMKAVQVSFTAASILSPPYSPIFLSKLITRTRNCLPRDFERRKLLMIWKKVPQPAIWRISPRCCTSRRCSTSTRSSTSRRCEQHYQRGGNYHPIIPFNKYGKTWIWTWEWIVGLLGWGLNKHVGLPRESMASRFCVKYTFSVSDSA